MSIFVTAECFPIFSHVCLHFHIIDYKFYSSKHTAQSGLNLNTLYSLYTFKCRWLPVQIPLCIPGVYDITWHTNTCGGRLAGCRTAHTCSVHIWCECSVNVFRSYRKWTTSLVAWGEQFPASLESLRLETNVFIRWPHSSHPNGSQMSVRRTFGKKKMCILDNIAMPSVGPWSWLVYKTEDKDVSSPLKIRKLLNK